MDTVRLNQNTARVNRPFKKFIVSITILLIAIPAAPLFAQDEEPEAGRQGLNFAFPAYLYGDNSACGAQLGLQLGKFSLRVDGIVVSGYRDDEMYLFAAPSFSAFVSQEWLSRIRTYQGVSLGGEIGILNSFDGATSFMNFLTGVEWYVFAKKAVFLEIGSGLSYPAKAGAYNGGTVIGGGIKSFF